jgi:hypothetical protein
MKYRIRKGNTSHQCAWLVEEAPHKHDWDIIAEFWAYADALLFRKVKNENRIN